MLPAYRAGILGALGAAALACAIGAAIVRLGTIPASTYAYTVGLLVFLTLGPLLIWTFARRGEAFALMPCITGFFLLEFAAGAVFYRHPRAGVLGRLNHVYNEDDMSIALLIALGAWLLILIGYYVTPALRARAKPRTNGHALGVATCLLTVGMAARVEMYRRGWYFHIGDVQTSQSAARNLVVIVASFPLVATAMVGYRYYRGMSSRALYWALIVGEIAWAVPSGERSRLVAIGLTLLVVAYYSPRPARPGPVIAGLLAVVLVVFPFGAAYRDTGGSAGYQADPITNVGIAASALVSAYANAPSDAARNGIDQALRRFAGATSLAAMVHAGADRYPVTPEQGVRIYASALVPRALMPGKVDPGAISNKFGVEYGIIRRGNPAAVAMTQVGDVWGTFGWMGLVLGMLLVGAFVRTADAYFADRRVNGVSIAVYAALLGGFLIGFETSVAVGLLQTCKEAVVVMTAIWVVASTITWLSAAKR